MSARPVLIFTYLLSLIFIIPATSASSFKSSTSSETQLTKIQASYLNLPLSFACSVPSTAPFIGICMPANNATVHSPVNIMAQTNDPKPVRLLQIYVDGAKKYEAHLSGIAVKLPISVGKHRVTVQEYNTSNVHFAKTIFIDVTP